MMRLLQKSSLRMAGTLDATNVSTSTPTKSHAGTENALHPNNRRTLLHPKLEALLNDRGLEIVHSVQKPVQMMGLESAPVYHATEEVPNISKEDLKANYKEIIRQMVSTRSNGIKWW